MSLVVASATASFAATIDIARDKWGVPHVFVPPTMGGKIPQLRALGFAQGYATAQDRMVQLEFFRRAGKGRLSEIGFLGPSYIPGDIEARRDGFTDAEFRTQFNRLPGKVRVMWKGFTDGVNKFLTDANANPSLKPGEFGLLGLNPQPWDISDTMAIGMIQIRRFGQNGGEELSNATLLLDLLDQYPEAEAKGIFNDLVWGEDPTAPTTIDPLEQQFTPVPYARFPQAQVDFIQAHETAIRGAAVAMAESQTMMANIGKVIGFPYEWPHTASNCLVIGGALSATGYPILLGGPQTGMTLPSFFYQIGLHGGGYDAAGVTVPAGGGLVIGRTPTAAWSITSGITDNTDVYWEELNPLNPKQYKLNGSWKNMECRMETFTPASQPVQVKEFCRTVHGPVFASYPTENIAFSRRIFFFGTEGKQAAQLVSLGFTKTLPQFKRTIDKMEASLNCHYADNLNAIGNIAYFHRGALPLRNPAYDARLPLPGTGDAETHTFLKGRRMPTAVNPGQGFIANWNNKPIKGWPADEQREQWGGIDRVQILIDGIETKKAANQPIDADDLTDIMKAGAVTDHFAKKIVPFLRAAVDGLPPATPDLADLESATDLMEAWITGDSTLLADNTAKVPFPGLSIYRAWRSQLQIDAFEDELGSNNRHMFYPAEINGGNTDDSGSFASKDTLLLRALQWPSAAVPASRDYFEDVNTNTNPGRDATLVESLRSAITTLTTQFGSADQSTWLTPKLLEKYSETSAAGILYGATRQERENRGTINTRVQLSPTITAEIIVPPGNSAHIPASLTPEPPHLRDQLALYEGFGFHANPFTLGQLEAPTTSQTVTLPY